jgi:hypothetical protein
MFFPSKLPVGQRGVTKNRLKRKPMVADKRPERCWNGGAAETGTWRVVGDFEKRGRSVAEVDIRHPSTYITREAALSCGRAG